MKSTTVRLTLLMAGAAALFSANGAQAGLVTWDVDPTASFMRLAFPDQSLPVEGIGNVTIRLRDANNGAWSDAGGRRAFLDGTLQTDLNDGSSVEFLSGSHNLFALEGTNVRPDPASFNPLNINAANPDGQYSGSATAPAAFGAKVRGTYIVTFDAAYLAFRDVFLDIASGVVPLAGGTTLANGSTNFGIQSLSIDADGLSLPLGLGQPIPDTLNATINLANSLNTAGGTVTNVGGLLRKLTYTVTVPIAINVEGIVITGSASGQVVAYALIPEPSSVLLASFAGFALCWAGRRRFRRR